MTARSSVVPARPRIRDDIVVMTVSMERRIVSVGRQAKVGISRCRRAWFVGDPQPGRGAARGRWSAIGAIARKDERGRMATWMEAPVEGLEAAVRGETGALLDGPPSAIEPWIVLDAGIWPGKSHPPGDSVPRPGPAPAEPRTGLLELEDATPRIDEVIAAWRIADRQLARLAEDDPEWEGVHAELVGLRALHHRLFEARRGASPTCGESFARWTGAIMAWGPAPLPARVMA
jgi:hypothetical protein